MSIVRMEILRKHDDQILFILISGSGRDKSAVTVINSSIGYQKAFWSSLSTFSALKNVRYGLGIISLTISLTSGRELPSVARMILDVIQSMSECRIAIPSKIKRKRPVMDPKLRTEVGRCSVSGWFGSRSRPSPTKSRTGVNQRASWPADVCSRRAESLMFSVTESDSKPRKRVENRTHAYTICARDPPGTTGRTWRNFLPKTEHVYRRK